MEKHKIVLMIMLGIAIYLITSLVVGIRSDSRGNACRELGFEKESYWNEEEVCEDKEGNVNFIKMDCDFEVIPLFIEVNCKAKGIKIGEVYGELISSGEE